MSEKVELDQFKQQVANIYSQRSNAYDEGDFHPRLACRLIECAEIQRGQKILDIATGTGLVAIEAAQLVGRSGQVVGVDISPGMLNQAKRKISTAGLNNVELQVADAELLNFNECASVLSLSDTGLSELLTFQS